MNFDFGCFRCREYAARLFRLHAVEARFMLQLSFVYYRFTFDLYRNALQSHPPEKPALRSPLMICGHSRISRQRKPERWFSIISTIGP
ncbi:hypothetical protein ATER59S_03434 [Aquamicrobium terrae]